MYYLQNEFTEWQLFMKESRCMHLRFNIQSYDDRKNFE